MKSKRTMQGVLMLVLCHFLWSTNNIAGRVLGGVLDPVTVTALRWLLAMPFYPLILGWSVIWGVKRYISVKTLILGLTGMVLFNIVLYESLALTQASLVGLAYGFTPALILIFSALTGLEKPSRLQVAGSTLSVLGVILLFTLKGAAASSSDILGLSLGVSTGVIWAVYTVLQGKFYPGGDQAALTYASIVLTAPLLGLTASPLIYTKLEIMLKPEVLLALLWIAVATGALGYYAWNKGVSLVGPAIAAPFANLIPVFTALLGSMLLGESLGVGDLVGGALIVLGSTISTIGGRH